MKQYGIMAGIILLCCISVVYADAGTEPGFISVSEEKGYILTELSVPRNLEDGTVSYWFFPSGTDCTTARLLGWQSFSQSSGESLSRKAAVPYGVTAGTYTIQALFTPGETIPSACGTGTSARTTLQIRSPGTAGRDMSGTLTEGAAGSGPRYRIITISGVDTTVRKAPGETISPVLEVTNTGSDDTSDLPVEVHAYLGSDELIPAGGTFAPLKAGESVTINPVYTIPEGISLQSYPFFVIVDPAGDHGPADAESNLRRTPGQLSVRIEEPDIGCGCK